MKYWHISVNPVVGCTPISPACDNCYASAMAHIRFANNPAVPQYHGLTKDGQWTGEVRLVPDVIGRPLAWKKPQWIFWGNMGDLFHEDVPVYILDRIRFVMRLTRHHTHILCTKRADRMRAYWDRVWESSGGADYPGAGGERIILMVTGEAQAWVNLRMPDLLAIRGNHLRALSAEPLLGPVDLVEHLGTFVRPITGTGTTYHGLDWVIIGDETGKGARTSDDAWLNSLRDQCRAAKVPCFVKQWRKLKIPDSMRSGPCFRKGGE